MKKIKTTISILLLFLGVIVLAACGQQTTKSSHKIQVVTSTNFYAEPAAKILGKYGQVTSVINSTSVDPHDYTATTADAKKTAAADVVIMNGAGYDSWLNKLVKSNQSSQAKVVNVAQDIRQLPNGENEHLWYDFNNMVKLTNRLTSIFSKQQPAQREAFKANSDKYIAQLKDLQKQTTQLKSVFSGQSVMITEPVFNYVLQALDMKIVNPDFAQDIEDGADPKPTELQKMKSQLKHKKVAFLVVNRQVESSLVNGLIKTAKAADVPVVYVTETMPKNQTYITWMKEELQQLSKIAKANQ